MRRHLYLFVFISLLWTSCAIDDDISEDPCVDKFLGTFEMLDTSLEALPYLTLPSSTKFIFINEAGEEALYQMEISPAVLCDFEQAFLCPENERRFVLYEYLSECRNLTLRSDDNELSFNLSLNTLPTELPPTEIVYDVFNIAGWEDDFALGSIFLMTIDSRNSNENVGTNSIETFEILNKTFTDVHLAIYDPLDLKVHYNFESGIIAFKDRDGVQWVLDRLD